MTDLERTQDLFDFIAKGVSPFHVVGEVEDTLKKNGFVKLEENTCWSLEEQKGYYVTRNDSSVIAFYVPIQKYAGYQIIASHCDSPTFRVKDVSELKGAGGLVRLNVERYGGMILSTWFDRPLSLAGRVMVDRNGNVETALFDAKKNLVSIPNLAIHMSRDVNDGHKFDVQKELMPILGSDGVTLKQLVASDLDVPEESILGMDISLYNREPGTVWGAEDEFCSAPRLDDLQCAYGSLQGFVKAAKTNLQNVPVLAIFDNEEVGSTTKQGAESTFLADTLFRINQACERTTQEYYTAVAGSFMISADNAHGIHPNYAEKADSTNYPVVNGGIVIKFNANQKYTSDSVSAALCRKFCDLAEVPCQTFANHSNSAGGSTLGNISNTQVSMNAVDIGLPQWAMHSAYESAGVKDTRYLVKLAETFYSSSLVRTGNSYRIETK